MKRRDRDGWSKCKGEYKGVGKTVLLIIYDLAVMREGMGCKS